MRLRLMYKLGPELKFLGNLDTLRMLSRCLRRAQIPFTLSEGFNPHIKMSLGTVLPVGIWSQGEWLDLDMEEPMEAQEVINRLNQNAPPGLVFEQAEYVDARIPTLMSVIDSACYCFQLRDISDDSNISSRLQELAASPKLEVQSRGKQKDKIKDLAPGIYRLEYVSNGPGEGIIIAWVASGSSFNVRPDELMEVFKPLVQPGKVVDCFRQGNYIKKGNEFKLPVAETFNP